MEQSGIDIASLDHRSRVSWLKDVFFLFGRARVGDDTAMDRQVRGWEELDLTTTSLPHCSSVVMSCWDHAREHQVQDSEK